MMVAKYLESSEPIVCEKCGHNTFTEQLMLRKLSKIITATQKDSMIPVPVFVCGKCGHVNESMLPPQLRKKPDNSGTAPTTNPTLIVSK